MPMPPEELRQHLRALVRWGDGLVPVDASLRRSENGPGFRREEIMLWSRPPLAATLLLPEGPGPHPAVLYCHAHGGEYALGRREVLEGARWLDGPVGPDLARAGFAVLAIDSPGFGDRQAEGTESATAKALFWSGKSLFGAMLSDLREALGYLADRDDIDADRLFTFGVSMGAAQAWWLAGLDLRVAGCAHASMLADIRGLLDAAVHDRHGLYYVVPGLLGVADQGDVAALVAPRPQFVALGAQDTLTPPGARDPALDCMARAYGAVPDMLETMVVPEASHGLTQEMREAAVGFLTRHARIKERIAT